MGGIGEKPEIAEVGSRATRGALAWRSKAAFSGIHANPFLETRLNRGLFPRPREEPFV